MRELISWKHSFTRLNEEYELAEKKKLALGSLLDTGKISQSTHSLFTREIEDAVAEIDNQRKALLGKMASKAMDLEEQIRTLEILLANFEIQHVAGEVDDDTYDREIEVLYTGMDMAKKELDDVQTAVNRFSSDEALAQIDNEPPQIQPSEPDVKLPDEPPENLETEQATAQVAVAEAVECKETPQPEPKTDGQRT